MYNDKATSLAIIPARGGSKRIPRKNLRKFLGVPILSRTIQVLQESGLFQEIVVSTDDQEIANLASTLGCLVPFIRPASLSSDFASTADVVNHSIDWLIGSGIPKESHFLVAYPTSVMTTPKQLQESKAKLKPGQVDLVFAGAKFESEIQRAWYRDSNGQLSEVFPGHQNFRSQDLRPAYFDAGQFYWCSWKGFREEVLVNPTRRALYEIPTLEAIDINNDSDWLKAEIIYAALREN